MKKPALIIEDRHLHMEATEINILDVLDDHEETYSGKESDKPTTWQ